MDKENYERTKQNSTSGTPVKRSSSKKIKMTRREYVLRMKALIGTTAVVTMLGMGLTSKVVNAIKDRYVLNKARESFHEEIIKPETHPTITGEFFYYDYIDIGQKIDEMEDIDEGVYLLLEDIGEYYGNYAMNHTRYKSFDNYLDEKGYESMDEFKKDMRKQILVLDELRDKQDELREMKAEHQKDVETEVSNKGEK